MKIHIGTKSPVKVAAIIELAGEYEILNGAEFENFKVDSGVSDQPMSLEETIIGAKNRARNIFGGCDLSFGIESGLMKIPETKTGYMNVTVCAIYDGSEFFIGLASLFEYPKQVTVLAIERGMEIADAFKKSGLTDKDKIGYAEGGIGFMTKGRVHSIEYYKQAIRSAMIYIENKELL